MSILFLLIASLLPNVHKASDSSGQHLQTTVQCVDFLPVVWQSYPLPNDIQSDLRYCLAKAIAIDEKVDLDKKLKINQQIYFPIDNSSERLNKLMERVTQKLKLNTSKNTSFKMTIDFEYSLDDNIDFLKSLNDYEWQITCLGNRIYLIKKIYLIYGDFCPEGSISYVFDLNKNSYIAQFNVSRTLQDEDYRSLHTKIKIKNDIVLSYESFKP
ncbi:MAG: hypothetical protein FGM46_07410 [Ferruginibacter sp.]|nr:hypothetical protein [Ferruginibacter sp.]